MAGYVTLEHLEKQLKLMDEQYLSVVYGHEYVTKDEYDQLKADGNINENKLYIIIDDDASAGGAGVVSGYYNSTNKKFYKDSTFTEEITGVEGGLYVDITANVLYRYDGTKFIAISSSSNIWQGTKAEYDNQKDTIPPGTLIVITDDDGDSVINVFEEVTQTEYNALPTSKLANGVAYIITDATPSKLIRNGKEIGGLTLEIVNKTQAQYNALTEAEKNDATKLYNITDADDLDLTNYAKKSDVDTVTSYSTNETVVATWIDGKPIYKKTYVLTNTTIQATTWTDLFDIPNNINKLIKTEIIGNCSSTTRGYCVTSPYMCISNQTKISVYSPYLMGVEIVTLWYTKTTD